MTTGRTTERKHRHGAHYANFPTDPAGLPEAARPALLDQADGDGPYLRLGAVAKRLGDTMEGLP
jgi:hypothetical protein